MFSPKASKIGKKRGGILHVFSKTISDLEILDKETTSQIEKQEEKMKQVQEEKSALETEHKVITNTVSKMKSVFILDDTTEEIKVEEVKE